MGARTVVIGDIHGCYFELMDLLDKTGVGHEDRLICVGDLITKGPRNREVLDFVRQRRNCEAVLGNQEYHLLAHWRGECVELEPAHLQTIAELGNDFEGQMDWISGWPLFIDLGDYLVVHAGIRPGIPMQKQSVTDLTSLRTLDGPEPGSKIGTPWFERYEGNKVVIFGHWVNERPLVRVNAMGIDTGCVYGGHLTAVILPEGRLVSVPAQRAYAKKT